MRRSLASFCLAFWSLVPALSFAQQPEPLAPGAAAPEPTPEPAAAPAAQPTPAPEPLAPAPTPAAAPAPAGGAPAAAPEPSPVKTKWSGTLYGWLQADGVYDSTQSFTEGSGGGLIAKPGTYTGEHGRMTFSYRNSRVGFRLNAPEVAGLKASGLVEFDFNGNQPPGITETAFWSNPTMRARHVWIKVEDDFVDVLFGQTWNVFGWQPFFHPNTLELQGIPGQLFSRAQQFKLSHTFKSAPVNVDVAVAAVRPPQRDAGSPDLQGGLKLGLNGWKGQHVGGAGATASADGLSIGVSGLMRRFNVLQFTDAPTQGNKKTGWGVSLDALLPIIPASSLSSIGALSLQGNFQTGSGFNDQYTGLTGGITFPTYPAPAMGNPAVANIDPGLVTYDAAGVLHTIDWKMFVADLQYFLPPAGNVWVSGNFSQMQSDNITDFATGTGGAVGLGAVIKKEQWWDVNLFWNVTPAVRLGAEYASFKQTLGDDTTRKNSRGQFSGFYLF